MTNPLRRINFIFWLTAVMGVILLLGCVIVLRYVPNLRWDHVAIWIICLIVIVILLVSLSVKRHIHRQ